MGVLKIKRITTAGFGGLPDGTYEIGDVTKVSGANGSGKTSLGRAILYVLTGLGLDGKPLAGAAVAEGDDKCVVSAEIVADGAPIPLVRARTEKSGSLKLNRSPMTDAKLEAFLGMPARTFAVMMWPELWFSLDELTQTAVVMSVAPPPDLQRLWDDTIGLDAEIDWAQTPKALHASWSSQRLEIEKEGAGIAGQIKELQIAIDAQNRDIIELNPEERELLVNADAEYKLANLEIKEHLPAADIWDQYELQLTSWERKAKAAPVDVCSYCGQQLPDQKRLDPGPKPERPTIGDPRDGLKKSFANRAHWEPIFDELTAKHRAVEAQKAARKAAGSASSERLGSLEAARRSLMEQYTAVKAIETALHPTKGPFWQSVAERQLEAIAIDGYQMTSESGKIRFSKDGRPVAGLSSGQRIKFCLALSGMIARFGEPGIKILFVEHMDLVDSLPRLAEFQFVGEKVEKGSDLSIEIRL